MALILGGLGSTVGGIVGGVLDGSSSSSTQGGSILSLDLGSLANLNIGAGGTTSVIAIDGTIGTTGSTPTSPVIDLGVDLGTGSTGGNGGLLGGLLGGGTAGGGGSLVPETTDALVSTVTSLTGLLTGSQGTGTGGSGTGGTTGPGGTTTVPFNPGSPGQVISGTEGVDTLYGTNGNDTIKAFAGNDVIFSNAGNDLVDGGSGTDTIVLSGTLNQYNAATQNGVIAFQNKVSGEIDYLTNVERVYFSDNKVLALDFNGNAGQAFRLYEAALDRAPDAQGLKFHVTWLDQGVSLHDDAQNFLNSPEFQQKYGSNLSDQQFVSALYQNTLERAPDAAGFAYWNNQLSTHAQDRASVLVGFSESTENHMQTDHMLQNGILLDYGVA
jgi:serralysin